MNLTQRTFLLISIPLLFELALVGAQAYLQNEAEQEAQRQYRAHRIVESINNLIHDSLQIGRHFRGLTLKTNELPLKKLHEQELKIRQDIHAVKELVGDNVSEQAALDGVENAFNRFCLLAEESIAQREKGNSTYNGYEEHRAEVYDLYDKLMRSMTSIIDEERTVEDNAPLIQAKRREQIRQLLLLAVPASFLIAIFLSMSFRRHLLQRISTLANNAALIAKREKLAPTLSGNDELAYLDRVLHDTADALEDAEQTKQAYISMISHDVRSPLTSLFALIELATNGVYGELNAKGYLQFRVAEAQLSIIISLLNQLLDADKFALGMLSLSTEKCQLRELIEESVSILRPLAENKNVNIELQASAPIVVNIDKLRIRQVALNLLSNAVKYSPHDSSIQVSLATEGGFATCRVSDKGRGVPDGYKEKIFQKFVQVEQADGQRGTGLGLAITRSLVELHGGTVGVDDAAGGGSIFWFKLPFQEDAKTQESAGIEIQEQVTSAVNVVGH